MSDVKQALPEGQEIASPPLRWNDPEVVRRWLSTLRTGIEDAQAATEDQLLPHRQRRLGHLEAERITRESFRGLGEALSFAERSLPGS